ncbi:hypothetical protein [Bacillus phage vB_BanS-Thrax5]|nr:hypothetical protein [Bacillus phage vB_BanS-Thrax5]
MKKSLAVLITMMMAFGMVGCGGVPQTDSNIQQEEEDCDLDDLYEGDEDCGFSKSKKKKYNNTNGVVTSPKTNTQKSTTQKPKQDTKSTSKPNLSKPSTPKSSSSSSPKVNLSKPSTPAPSRPSSPPARTK